MSKHITYIAPAMSSFVSQDIEFLSREYKVRILTYSISDKYEVLYKSPSLFFNLLFSKVDVFLVSFGGYHSFITAIAARIRRKPIYIILNGTDSVSIPEYNYGHLRGGLLKAACLASYRLADKLLPVSESLIATVNGFAFEQDRELGLSTFDEDLVEKCEVIYNGFDDSKWKLQDSSLRNSQRFITVAGGMQVARLKGLDLIFEVAPSLPDCEFVIVGMDKPDMTLSSNIVFKGRMSPNELRIEYNRASYYLQLSVWEGFGCALCEAMMCGCTPVVSDSNFLPAIAADMGYVLSRRDSKDLFELLSNIKVNDRRKLHQSILTRFSIEKRLDDLIKILEN